MKKLVLFVPLLMLLFVGCKNDEITKCKDVNIIKFGVTAEKHARAVETTTNTIEDFKVWAFTEGKLYMNGTDVLKSETGKWIYDDIKFWPDSPVDFFALNPSVLCSGTLNIGESSRKIENYVVVNGSEDLLYAVNIGEKRGEHETAPINIGFRHALSQIIFKIKKTQGSSIDIKVKGIKIAGIANTSTFTFKDMENCISDGCWSTPDGEVDYTAVNLENAYEVTTTASYLTQDAGYGALFLMPQKLKPWLTISEGRQVVVTGTARLLVNCCITDSGSGIVIWPDDGNEYGEVAVSLNNPNGETGWIQGKKYIYTLVFGEGGGYTPDMQNPKPVLVPISFDVNVSDFINGSDFDVDANGSKNDKN